MKATKLILRIKNTSGIEHTVYGYELPNKLILVPGNGDDCDVFFESLDEIRRFIKGEIISVEKDLAVEITKYELLKSVVKSMKATGSKNIPLERIFILLWQIHSLD